VEIYLCRKLTGEKLKSIGFHFGISDSAVSQTCNRLEKKLEVDRRLRIQVSNIEKRIRKTSRVETPLRFDPVALLIPTEKQVHVVCKLVFHIDNVGDF
jgi:hypothetical protein